VSTEQPGQHGHEPTEEELRAAFEEQMRRITVPDVLVQTAVTLVNLGSQKLAEDHDLEQARAAIEGARTLLPLLPEEVQSPLKDALSQLQMAFVRESQDPGGQPDAAEAPQQEPGGAQEPGAAQEPGDDEAERAKARAKIWTPPGT
jgi:hypothetical protein